MENFALDAVSQEIIPKLSHTDTMNTNGTYKQGIHITGMRYVGTVLTYESTGLPNILKSAKQCTPKYAHHVVLMPLIPLKYGTLFMKSLSMPRYLARSSKRSLNVNVAVSVSLVGLLHQDAYNLEIQFRKKYGIIAALNWRLVKSQIIARGESFRIFTENPIHFELDTFNWPNEDVDAMLKAYNVMFIEKLSDICIQFQPIILD